MAVESLPYFIQIRGCINCSASKYAKERYGMDYTFVHENILCLLTNCSANGHELHRPYIDPAELVRLARVKNNPKFTNWVRNALATADDTYRGWFAEIGISLENLINELDA